MHANEQKWREAMRRQQERTAEQNKDYRPESEAEYEDRKWREHIEYLTMIRDNNENT